MPLNKKNIERSTFFESSALDNDLPKVNEAFWRSLIGHIEEDGNPSPQVILDIGCHTGGLLLGLGRRFFPIELIGIEPLAAARQVAEKRLIGAATKIKMLDVIEWDKLSPGSVDLVTSHEMLYLEPDLQDFMTRIRRVLKYDGVGYVVLGCHAENPLWQTWKVALVNAGHRVYDHLPIDIMKAASSVGLRSAVQPLRTSGWVTYDPLKADFQYPDVRTMFDHHYRHKLIFSLRIANESTDTF